MMELVLINTERMQMTRFDNGKETHRLSFEFPLQEFEIEYFRKHPDGFIEKNAI